MSDVITTEPTYATYSRGRQRLERQARVGLLRNPNRPPKPPPRRAALMGKWLDLRTSRRRAVPIVEKQKTDAVASGTEHVHKIEDALAHDHTGRVSSINIDGLMHAVRSLGTNKPLRTPYGGGYRADLEVENPQEDAQAAASILSAHAWEDEHESPPPAVQIPPARQRARRLHGFLRGTMIVGGGVLMAFVVLLMLPAVSAFP